SVDQAHRHGNRERLAPVQVAGDAHQGRQQAGKNDPQRQIGGHAAGVAKDRMHQFFTMTDPNTAPPVITNRGALTVAPGAAGKVLSSKLPNTPVPRTMVCQCAGTHNSIPPKTASALIVSSSRLVPALRKSISAPPNTTAILPPSKSCDSTF